jgi:hypothetical protein
MLPAEPLGTEDRIRLLLLFLGCGWALLLTARFWRSFAPNVSHFCSLSKVKKKGAGGDNGDDDDPDKEKLRAGLSGALAAPRI